MLAVSKEILHQPQVSTKRKDMDSLIISTIQSESKCLGNSSPRLTNVRLTVIQMEIWFNEGDVYARTNEQDIEREGFRKLGLRICATDEELKKYENPKRLPECVRS